MIVSFDIPDAIVTELNTIAVAAGFANAKKMTMAYWRAAILSAREKATRDAIPSANMSDVVIS